jgi:hypothetical protein
MTSKTEIANRALIRTGTKVLSDFDAENSEQARVCRAVFPSVVRAELRRQAWSFAIERANLAVTLETPPADYASVYNLPTDLLRLVQVRSMWVFNVPRDGPDTDPIPGYEINGRKLLIDETGSLPIRYVKDLSNDLANWDAAFVDAVAMRLALEVAPSLTKLTEDKRRGISGDYKLALSEARRTNAIELPPALPPDGSWVTSRFT